MSKQQLSLDDVVHVLMQDWNPTGDDALASDYAPYAAPVLGWLRSGHDAPTIADYLHEVATEEMALPAAYDQSRQAAEILVSRRDGLH